MLFYGISLIMKEKSNASALGSRDGRAWEQKRLRLGRDHLNVGRRLLTSRIFIKAVLK